MAWEVEVAQGYYAWDYYDSRAINNAWEIYRWFRGSMTLEAICGIIGNACYESRLNPGQIQVPNGPARGLIQWDPPSSLVNYVNTWYDGDEQCELILREGRNDPTLGGSRFYPSRTHPQYDYSWSEYCEIFDVSEATKAYFYERERGTWADYRLTLASYYLSVLQGEEPPTPPTPPVPPRPTTRKKMPLYMMCRRI